MRYGKEYKYAVNCTEDYLSKLRHLGFRFLVPTEHKETWYNIDCLLFYGIFYGS